MPPPESGRTGDGDAASLLGPEGVVPSGWRLEEIDDPEDARLDAYRRLTDMDLRRTVEVEGGYFMAEGRLVIERVAAAGYSLQSVLTAPRWLGALSSSLGSFEGPVYLARQEVVDAIAGFRVHRGALAVVRRPPPRPVEEFLSGSGHLLLLEDLVDHTNVGLAFRSAGALGVAGVVLSSRCADPLYRRSVKASMGAVLAVPWARSQDWDHDLDAVSHAAISSIALTPDPTAPTLDAVLAGRRHERVALLVGSEGPGLSPRALRACETAARIPMHHGIDSLNAAAAVAVASYALLTTARSASHDSRISAEGDG